MNRKNIISLIVLDVIVMLMAAGLMMFRYSSLTNPVTTPLPAASATPAADEISPAAVNETPVGSRPAVSGKKSGTTRNIGFVFRHSKAKNVAIIGDFNDWIPEPMKKGGDFKWTFTQAIEPGEYSYNFIVDGRPVRDPNNARISDTGRGFASSRLTVKPR
ncbi:MAG: hypothetical protein A2219_04505 [Elusimicrobia bacterium RIFOXYA2_FULL_50_26]|nr:MAG: hypothetical protein A2219_04505 [Elusimicrobia bacterium RIFOXYA2_FULL_50_26]OGS23788.1 MAG: hypothetical protein A2314_08930 [Elusimicrobia bacterium RIFOXYB2_FULL_50_12]